MRSAGLKLLFLSLLLGAFLPFPVFAAEGNPGTEQWKNDLTEIKARLATLEAGQKEILAKEDNILKELVIVKKWVHRK